MAAVKRLVGVAAAALGAVAVSWAPSASANADTQFIACLNNHGYVVTNAPVALHWAGAIANDLQNGISVDQIEYNLTRIQGFEAAKADVYVQCVAAVILQGA